MDGITDAAVQPTEAPDAPAENAGTVDASQGQGSSPTSAFFPSADTLPDTLSRDEALELFRQSDANITKEFQRRAEAAKEWEAYEQVGLKDFAPEDVGKLIAFAEIAADDQLFTDWVKDRATALGLLEGDGESEAEAGAGALEGEPQELTPETVEKLIADALAQRDQQAQQEREEAAQFEAFQAQVNADLEALHEEHGEFDDDEVLFQATRFGGDVKKGFEQLQKLIGTAQREVVEKKLGEKEPVKGGRSDATPEPVTDFATARERTLAQIREALST